MKNILYIARHNLRMFFNNSFSVMMLAAPVLITVMLVMMLNKNQYEAGIPAGLIMSNHTVGGEALITEMKGNVNFIRLDEKTALSRLKQKKLSGVISIRTNNILKDLINNKKSIEFTGVSNNAAAKFLTQELDAALYTVSIFAQQSQGDEKQFNKLYDRYRKVLKEVRVDNSEFEAVKSSMVFGMFVMISLFTSIKGLQGMMQEKENKVYERICISPVKTYEYILGHISGAFGILMIQTLIQGSIMYQLRLTFGLSLFTLIGICMLLDIVGISLSLIILACTQNTQSYFITGSFLIAPICMLSDCIFPKELLPEVVNKISFLSPIRWIMILYKTALAGGDSKDTIMGVLIVLGLSAILILTGMVIENSRKTV